MTSLLLNPSQKEAVVSTEGPLLVLAGAGSGKTRVITNRAVYLLQCGVKADAILCLTFTNKAAKEMKERIVGQIENRNVAARIKVSTFHSFCLTLLKKFFHFLNRSNEFSIYDSRDQEDVLKNIFNELELPIDGVDFYRLIERISYYKNNLIEPQEVVASSEEEKFNQLIYERYQEALKFSNAVDFNDLIYHSYFLLRNFEQVRNFYQKKYQYLMVDEYQDTNHLQYELLKLLLSEKKNLMVVGDDDQSIYSWRGAKIENILNFEKDFSQVKVITLQENYRSSYFILAAANAIIKNNITRHEKKLVSQLQSGEKLDVVCQKNPFDQSYWLAREVKQKQNKYSSIAILYRTKNQSNLIEKALIERGVSFNISRGMSFYDYKEIKDLIAFLKILNNLNDDLSFVRTIHAGKWGIGDRTIAKIFEYAKENELNLFQALKQRNFYLKADQALMKNLDFFEKMINSFYDKIKGQQMHESFLSFIEHSEFYEKLSLNEKNEDRLQKKKNNIKKFLEMIEVYISKSKKPSAQNFLLNISLALNEENSEVSENTINMMTIHAAKGLEFDLVYIVGFEEDSIPFLKKDDEESFNLDEERRLCYVAITRAKKKCVLSFCREKKNFKESIDCQPSRFLYEIPENCYDLIEVTEDFKKQQQEESVEKGIQMLENFLDEG